MTLTGPTEDASKQLNLLTVRNDDMEDDASVMDSTFVPSTLPADTDFADDDADRTTIPDDSVFQQIQAQIERQNERRLSVSTATTETQADEAGLNVKTSDNFIAVPYGFQPRDSYEHSKKQTDIMGMVYNERMKKFVVLDSKGITTWCKDAVGQKVVRTLTYPRYEYRLINSIVYAKKYNVYFALGKEFSLRVLNRDFDEVCSVTSGIRSILFMLFNPIRDELITGGVGGTKVWAYRQVAQKTFTEIKPMANYQLQLKYELPNVGGSWVKRVELDLYMQHLYCCSDTDLFAYDLDGNEVFHFERAHQMSITGCAFSLHARLLVTGSVDSDVKAWSLAGGLVHTFRGHSRPVTNLILHPETSSLFLTSSLDGSVRIWSLDTMEGIYSIVVSTEGVLWMGLTDEKLLYLGTMRAITLWSLNHVTNYWAQTRNKVLSLELVSGDDKSTRVMAIGDDSSVRIFARKTQKNLTTILPPPALSPMQNIRSVAYNRIVNVVYLLMDHKDIWVYTARTDPACRIAVWDALEIQQELVASMNAEDGEDNEIKVVTQRTSVNLMKDKSGPTHRATENGSGNESISSVCCLSYLNSTAMVWTDEGFACPIQHHYLLWGMEDGRILFMDPVVRRRKHFEFRANKDAILAIKHDPTTECLMTRCRPGDYSVIQIWSLPKLDLLYEVYSPPDVTGFVRMGTSVITTHQSGSVLTHTLVSSFDNQGVAKFKNEDGQYKKPKKDHAGPVISLDACQKLGIFITCSPDGAVKVWEENKTLLTELTLDDTITSVSFLNSSGDVVIGYRNHVFHIDHSRICPSLKVAGDLDQENETESDIFEDPAVMYEGVSANPDPVDLENYLVPFDIDFSTDFLEGRKSMSPTKSDKIDEGEHEDAESEISAAPTDMYASPYDTPRRLSVVDLTLSRDVTQGDLRTQMRHMLEGNNMYRDQRSPRYESEEEEELVNMKSFEFPTFGVSPGPSPTPSPPSTLGSPASMAVSEDGASSPEPETAEIPTFKPINVAVSTPADKVEAPKAKKKDESSTADAPSAPPKPVASRFSNIKIDSAELMKNSRVASKSVAVPVPRKEADHAHVRPEEPIKPKASRSVVIKKKERRSAKERKMPKRAERKRSSVREEDIVTQISREDVKPAAKQTTPPQSRRPSIKPVVVEESSSSDEEEEATDANTRRRSIPKSSLEMKPRTFGAGAAAGAASKPPPKKSRRPIEAPPEQKQKPTVGLSPTPDSMSKVNKAETSPPGDASSKEKTLEVIKDAERSTAPSPSDKVKKRMQATPKTVALAEGVEPPADNTVTKRDKVNMHQRRRGRSGSGKPLPKSGHRKGQEGYQEAGGLGGDQSDEELRRDVALPTLPIPGAELLRGYHQNQLDRELEELGFDSSYEDGDDPLRNPTPPGRRRDKPLDLSGIQEAMDMYNTTQVDYMDLYSEDSNSVTDEDKRKRGELNVRKYNIRKPSLEISVEDEELLQREGEIFPHADRPPSEEGRPRLSLKDIAARGQGGAGAATSLLAVPEASERPSSAKKGGRGKPRGRGRSPRASPRASPAHSRSSSPVSATRGSGDTGPNPDDLRRLLGMDVATVADIPGQLPSRAASAKSILKPSHLDDLNRSGNQSRLSVAFRDIHGAVIDPDSLLLGRSPSPGDRRSTSPMARSLTPGSEAGYSDDERYSPVQDILDRLGSGRVGSARHRLALELAALNGDIPPEYHPDYRPEDEVEEGGYSRAMSPGARVRSAQGSRARSAGVSGRIRSAGLPDHGYMHERAASPTMTIYSDHGSEWTVPAPDESELSRLDDILEEEERLMKQLRENWARGMLKPRPNSATASTSQARPNTPQDGIIRPWRPRTAHELPSKTEDLRAQFDDALRKFQGPPESQDYVDKLYRNDGVQFDGTYHDRQIERHLLLRMQKQLRAQSANEKRQLLQLRQQQRRKALLGHGDCDIPAIKSQPDTTLHVIRNAQQRAATAGPSTDARTTMKVAPGYRSAGPSVMGYHGGRGTTPGTRPNTAATRATSRAGTALSRTGTAFSPYNEHLKIHSPEKSEMGAEKPFRLGSIADVDVKCSTPEPPPILDPIESYQFLQSLFNPSTSGGSPAPRSDPLSDLHLYNNTGVRFMPSRSPRSAKSAGKKRVRIAKDPPKLLPKHKIATEEDVRNAKLLDPRNPKSRFYRQPSKSIPSKCSRYILITHPKGSQKPIEPTPLEQQLIEERFPEWRDKWLHGTQASPRQQYISDMGITPYKDYEPQPIVQ